MNDLPIWQNKFRKFLPLSVENIQMYIFKLTDASQSIDVVYIFRSDIKLEIILISNKSVIQFN